MFSIDFLSQHRIHDGILYFIRHDSVATGVPMQASVFIPDVAEQRTDAPFPTLYWLSGLTCTAANFTEKAGAYRKASELGLIIVAPDTSPRGPEVADDPASDLGQGAGFYLDATQGPWSAHFQMESYIIKDLIAAIESNFPADPARRGIFGHSMGGHGALTLAMNYPHLFRSVSAFAPIASAMHAPWGEKALAAYLGSDHARWERYDAALRLAQGGGKPFDDILIDQGLADPFLENQLMPERLEQAAATAGQKISLRYQDGYDHSYYFIRSFIDDHLAFHADRLKAGN
ncbi:S-formylglutathione hydrolase [Asticcacaulis sp. EMRT-3]|uniref:S-formylglutathione hydrolase n=1 Tax=Asticcacaulis sp. EMRT-3 TaxID=3040349 RepID=UPI0024AF20DB|nr:S-formylglutathione hydrolase [Asticcacaulis sp. EMRT-3]MDI7774101.1 S-formylglutathione hydrolase [Asticcacaulis sp. EMRT-3]